MAISNNSTGLRPGVCTSSTRPTAPYEGQHIYETDTDLTYVWGGSAWQQVSGGTAVGNSGLVYIKSQTIGTTVSTVAVSDAFSATYDNYKITISGGGISTAQTSMSLVLGSSTSTYYGSYIYANWSTGAVAGAPINNASSFLYAGGVDINAINCNIEIQNPFLAKYTNIQALSVGYSTIKGSATGSHESATSFSSFTLAPSTGTFSGGTITVYGYRKA
jgi:hypothetical protein